MLAAFAAALIARDARADEDLGYRVGAEVDPLPFFEHGFSVHAEAKPFARLRSTFGAFALRSSTSSRSEAACAVRVSCIDSSGCVCRSLLRGRSSIQLGTNLMVTAGINPSSTPMLRGFMPTTWIAF